MLRLYEWSLCCYYFWKQCWKLFSRAVGTTWYLQKDTLKLSCPSVLKAIICNNISCYVYKEILWVKSSFAFAFYHRKTVILAEITALTIHSNLYLTSHQQRTILLKTPTKYSEMIILNNSTWLCIFTSISINSVRHQWQFTTISAIKCYFQLFL